MLNPRLLHPVLVTIQQIDRDNTFQDEDYREPVQQSARKVNVSLQGQITWERHENVRNRHLEIGDIGDSDGAVLFRLSDLERLGIELAINDRIIQCGSVELDCYISSFQYTGHYSHLNGPAFLKAFFVDKRPKRQGRGIR